MNIYETVNGIQHLTGFYHAGDLTLTGTITTIDGNRCSNFLGKVGIGGYGSPMYKLDVLGDIRSTGTIYGNVAGTTTNADMVDSLHGTQFLRNDTSGTINGSLTIDDRIKFSRDSLTNNVIDLDLYGGSDFPYLNIYETVEGYRQPTAGYRDGDLSLNGTITTWNSNGRNCFLGGVSIGYYGNPGNMLEVAGDIHSTGTIYGNGVIQTEGTGCNYFLGGVSIGTTEPSAKLNVYNSATEFGYGDNIARFGAGFGNFSHIGYGPTGDWYIRSVSGTGKIIMQDSGGDVGIGTSEPGYKLDVAGSCHATSFPTSSDERLKTNIRQLSGVLDKIDKIRGVAFNWNSSYETMGRSTGHREIGVIAQEVEAQFPELVTTWGDEHYRAVDYGRLTAVLIEAVKELKAENELQQREIERLTSLIESQE